MGVFGGDDANFYKYKTMYSLVVVVVVVEYTYVY